jgi:hypothetical protein
MAELVKRMITPNRISKQLIPIIKLAECLLDVNCVEGAKMIGDAISTFFVNMEHGGPASQASQASTVTLFCVKPYLGMVLTLERNPKTSDLTRMESFVIFFSRVCFQFRPDPKTFQIIYLFSFNIFVIHFDFPVTVISAVSLGVRFGSSKFIDKDDFIFRSHVPRHVQDFVS